MLGVISLYVRSDKQVWFGNNELIPSDLGALLENGAPELSKINGGFDHGA
jgi:hypothetical protein